jgi:hypothetical protein
MRIDPIRIAAGFDPLRLEMKIVPRPKVQPNISVSAWIVPKCALIGDVAKQLRHEIAAYDFALAQDCGRNLYLAGMIERPAPTAPRREAI